MSSEAAATPVVFSDVVADWNPYSRLMALKRMGIVKDYQVSVPTSTSLPKPSVSLRRSSFIYQS